MNSSAVAALVEVQLVAALLGINFTQSVSLKKREFTQSVSLTDVYCTNVTVYNRAILS